jgi:hypothetical protein
MVLVLAIGHGKKRVILHLIDGTILLDLLAICVGLTIFLIKSCLGWIGLSIDFDLILIMPWILDFNV